MSGKSPEFERLEDYFTCNIDESRFLASDGIIRVIGNSKKRKHEKNISDSRDSITIVRVVSEGELMVHVFISRKDSDWNKNFSSIFVSIMMHPPVVLLK